MTLNRNKSVKIWLFCLFDRLVSTIVCKSFSNHIQHDWCLFSSLLWILALVIHQSYKQRDILPFNLSNPHSFLSHLFETARTETQISKLRTDKIFNWKLNESWHSQTTCTKSLSRFSFYICWGKIWERFSSKGVSNCFRLKVIKISTKTQPCLSAPQCTSI